MPGQSSYVFEMAQKGLIHFLAPDTIPRFYVIVATSYPEVEVVSVIEFAEEAWDWLGKIMDRRRK